MDNTKDLFKEKIDDLVVLLKDNKFKNKFIDAINKDINIPMINEKTEKKIFNSLYNVLIKHVENAINEINE